MSENDKDLEVNIKGKVSPDKDSKRNQDRKRLNEQTNEQRQQNESESLADQESSGPQDDILPSLDEVDESENPDGLDDVNEGEGLVDNELKNEEEQEDPEEQENEEQEDEEDSEEEDSEEQEEDSEENSDENDDESKNESKDEENSDDKAEDSKESSSEDNKYNNNQDRMNLNPNRAEAPKGPDTSKAVDPKEGGGAGSKLAGKAKDAVSDKLMANENVKNIKKAAEAVSNTATTAVNVGNGIIQLLINPITWVVLGLAVLFIYLASFVTTVGQNDFNIMCDDSGVGSIAIDASADDFTRQAAIASWLTSTPFEINGGQPFTDEQAAGVIGNLITESYGADPRAIQGDVTTTQWETCDNDCVLGWGNVGGKAIGIVQWDRGRRIGLVNFAKQEGTQWHDLTTQLKFLKYEIESGYERDQLVAGGFNQPGKSVAEYTRIWNTHFERSAAAGTPEGDNPRIANAEQFASSFTGGSFSFSGLSDSCVGGSGGLFAGGGIDTSSLVQLAIQSAHPRRSSALESCGNNIVNCGQNTATDAYKQAKIAAEAATSNDPIRGLLASCDRFIATMYRATGKDPNYPWGSSTTQAEYMKNSPDWEQVSCQDRQPGDVLWRQGHTMLYVGMVNGTDSIASASLGERSGNLSRMSCQADLFVADGDTAIGFRKVR